MVVPQPPNERVSVEVADPVDGIVIVVGLNMKLLDDRQVGRFCAVSVTVPVYPLRLVPVTVTWAVFLNQMPMVGGEMEIEKSLIVRVTGAVCTVGAEVPWTWKLTVEVAQLEPKVRVIVDGRVDPLVRERLDGLNVAVAHDGRPTVVRDTVPVNPLRLATLTVTDPDRPAVIVVEDGLVDTEKSVTCTGIVTV